jgi:adenine-specific DNA-methyltransferase
MAPRAKKSNGPKPTKSYRHTQAESPLRPDVGTQAQFKKKKPPTTYRYDSSLAPELSWDGQNATRELGEWLLARIKQAAALPAPHTFPHPREFKGQDGKVLATVRGLEDAVERLGGLGAPFLNWAGKAERLSFEVPALPLFVHERLSTKAIIETLKGHRKDDGGGTQLDLFGDPQHSIADQVLRAYEYRDKWVNRMILGDSLVVMNSLLAYEGLGGKVQMIYIDPPYGVKFGSNFQPFVRKRDVKHNDDEDMTREPEMVKAYRDTWELGLHSYLTYMRDRLFLARELLTPSGSIFVQISDENLHHVRELMDEVFGGDNFCAVIAYKKTGGLRALLLPAECDYILWYGRDKARTKYRQLYMNKSLEEGTAATYSWVRFPNGSSRGLTRDERANPGCLPSGARIYKADNLTSQGNPRREFVYRGKPYMAGWKTTVEGMERLAKASRIHVAENSIMYIRFLDDFPAVPLTQLWDDTSTATGSFMEEKLYVVQTSSKAIQRCILMTTDPGDLVLDPTCGSGTTAYVAEQWGRRWITIDCSRVPLALARQRILTATFSWYELKDEALGPAGGLVYKRRQNIKGEEVGGIVPHVTLKSIANGEPPDEEVLVDRPEVASEITRVSGPFCFEATIPTPVDWEGDGIEDSGVAEAAASYGSFVDRMIEVLRKSPVLHVGGGKTVTLKSVRQPAKTLSLSAEASVSSLDEKPILTPGEALQGALEAGGVALPFSDKPVAIVFGPENGAVSEKLVYEAAREAHAKNYSHLYVIGFAIQPNARKLVDDSEAAVGVAATYVQATPDLMMGDLLKNMRSSQIFSVCGLPEITVRKVKAKEKGEPLQYQVELLGLDVFDPSTMETEHRAGGDVPAWFLDTDYNDLSFHVGQAFFPRTGAWEGLKKALKGTYEESVWDHLAGTTSAPFGASDHGQIAVKVIDDRGNELLVVKKLGEAVG